MKRNGPPGVGVPGGPGSYLAVFWSVRALK